MPSKKRPARRPSSPARPALPKQALTVPRGSRRPVPHHQSGPPRQRRPELAEGRRRAGRRCSRTSILREKITHFDHERIPERVVHARGSGAHGYFQVYESLAELHHGRVPAGPGKRDAGLRALLDRGRLARLDRPRARRARLRGEVLHRRGQLRSGRQQHPGLLHPGRDQVPRPGPRRQAGAAQRDSQAASAHDTFWDFISLMPESMHMIMWVMSDRAIPRSFRMMEGFGVHTFRLRQRRGRRAS